MTAIFTSLFQASYSIYNMISRKKVNSHSRNMDLNRTSMKKHKILIFFGQQNGDLLFLSKMFYSPLGYLAGIMV